MTTASVAPVTVPSPSKAKKMTNASVAAQSTSPSLATSTTSAAPKGKARSSSSASVNNRKGNPEKRASHNAIERARRESLNNRFLILAASLPSISEIRRPSKSLIVNRSLQFVSDSLSREDMYRNMIKEMHANQVRMAKQLHEYRNRVGEHDHPESLPVEPTLPKALADADKERPGRPRPSKNAGTANSDSGDGENGDGDMDDYDDFDDNFPMAPGSFDGLHFSMGHGSDAAAAAPFGHYALDPQQLSFNAASAGFVAPTQVVVNAGSTTPTSGSPPELSSSGSSTGTVESSGSPIPTPVAALTPQLFDMAQPFPFMTAPALAAAAKQQVMMAPPAAPHVRSNTAPTYSHGHPSQQQQAVGLNELVHRLYNESHATSPGGTNGFDAGAYANAYAQLHQQFQQQQQHNNQQAAAAAAYAAFARGGNAHADENHGQQHHHHHQQRQQQQQQHARRAQAPQEINIAALGAPGFFAGQQPLPSPFLTAPLQYNMA